MPGPTAKSCWASTQTWHEASTRSFLSLSDLRPSGKLGFPRNISGSSQALLRSAQEVLRPGPAVAKAVLKHSLLALLAASSAPGFVRLGVHFTMSEKDVELLASAVAAWLTNSSHSHRKLGRDLWLRSG